MSLEQRNQGIMAKRRCTDQRTSLEIIAAFPPGQSPFEKLPDELHLNVFKHLAPTYPTLKYTPRHQDHRADLRNMCLVSKRMGSFAREALYKKIQLNSNNRAIRLFATLFKHPELIAHVKSILFFPPHSRVRKDSTTIDLRALQSVDDPDFAYWTTGGDLARVRMPQVTRDKMVFNLLFKVLSKTPGLEALYIRLPKNHATRSARVFRQTANAKCRQELSLQNRLFAEASVPQLPNLKTVGILGGDLHWQLRDSLCSRALIPLFQSLLRSPKLEEVCWAGLQFDAQRTPEFWDAPLLTSHAIVGNVPAAPNHFAQMSTSVKSVNLRGIMIHSKNIGGLVRAFPSMESLTVEDDCSFDDIRGRAPPVPQNVFDPLGQLGNLHTLVLDNDPAGFGTYAGTATGICKTVDFSAMSRLQTLVVSLDFLAYFTLGENALIQRATTILPGSLRCLTLLLNDVCEKRLRPQFTRKFGVEGVLTEFMQDLAASFLVQFPHLRKVDLCHHMKHYRRNKVSTLADRSATRPS